MISPRHAWLAAVTVILVAGMAGAIVIYARRAPVGTASWETVLQACGASDLQKTRPLYFGAANANGVGSIWSVDSSTGDYWPSSQLQDITSRQDIVFTNAAFSCSGEVRSGVAFNMDFNAKPVVFPASLVLREALSQAVSAKVSVESIVQQDAYWDRFNAEIGKLPLEHPVMRGIQLANRVVVARAWKVRRFAAVLSYEGKGAVRSKAELDHEVASGNVNLSIELVSDNTLKISSDEDLYVAGVFRKLSPGGVSAGTSEILGEWISVPETAQVESLELIRPEAGTRLPTS
jgi:hypothetical protein